MTGEFGVKLCDFLMLVGGLAVAFGEYQANFNGHKAGHLVAAVGTILVLVFVWWRSSLVDTIHRREQALSTSMQTDNQRRTEDAVEAAKNKILNEMHAIQNTQDSELLKKYPYGYVLFGSARGQFVRFPPKTSEVAGVRLDVKADWQKASIIVDRHNERYEATVKIPGLVFQTSVFRVDFPPGTRILFPLIEGQTMQVGAYTENQPAAYFEVLNASPEQPIVVMGFNMPGKATAGFVQVDVSDYKGDDPIFTVGPTDHITEEK